MAALHTVKTTTKQGTLISQFTSRRQASKFSLEAFWVKGVLRVEGPEFGTVIHKTAADALKTLDSWSAA